MTPSSFAHRSAMASVHLPLPARGDDDHGDGNGDGDAPVFHATMAAFLDEYEDDVDVAVDMDAAVDADVDVDVARRHILTTSSESSFTEPDAEDMDHTPIPSPPPRTSASTSTSAARPSRPAKAARKNRSVRALLSRHRAQQPEAVAATAAGAPKSRKEELAFLRQHVSELEEKLRLLHKTASNSAITTTRGNDTTEGGADAGVAVAATAVGRRAVVDSCGPRTGTSMWEQLALRQYQQRQRAEVENLKLRSMLEDQLKVAKSLQRMLKRSKCDLLTPKNHVKRVRRLREPTADEEAAVFANLAATMEAMHSEVDAVLMDPRFHGQSADAFRDVDVQQDDRDGTCVQVLTSYRIPFGVQATANAVWHHFVNESISAHGFHVEREVEATEDSIMKSLRVELQIKRYFGRFRGKIAGRRYRDGDDRVVIVWAALVEPVEVSDASMDGIIMRQRGWSVVRRAPPSSSPSSLLPLSPSSEPSASTFVQSKHVAIPTVYDDIPDLKRKLQLLTNYMIYLLHGHVESSQQMIENLLIERMLGGDGSGGGGGEGEVEC